jgi:hypothetical protein
VSRRVALATLVPALALLAGCVATEEDPPPPTASPPPVATADAAPATATATPGGPPTDAEVVALLDRAVCWRDDPALAASCLPPSTDALEAIAAMGASGDWRFVAPLIDMRWLDLRWGEAIEDALLAITGVRLGDPYAWYGFGYDAPATPGYREWKAALLSITATAETSPRFDELRRPFEPGDDLTRLLVWTGVQPNGRPPLTSPEVVHRLDADYLAADDVVYGLAVEGEARAYPRRVVAWHGAVNDAIGGTPVLLAHCLPCGGAVAFDRRLEGEPLTFGNAGLALLGRTLLFDEQSLRLWDAFTGVSGSVAEDLDRDSARIEGLLRLDPLPLVTTTWGAWSAAHPETGVLWLGTGFDRDYASGAALAEELASEAPLYPAPTSPVVLALKEPVLGLELNGARRAYPVADIEARGVVHDLVAEQAVVLLSEGPEQGTRAYASGDAVFDRVVSEDGVLVAVDVEDERWFVLERALVSTLDGRERPRLVLRQGYWFAWSGANPETTLWDGGS